MSKCTHQKILDKNETKIHLRLYGCNVSAFQTLLAAQTNSSNSLSSNINEIRFLTMFTINSCLCTHKHIHAHQYMHIRTHIYIYTHIEKCSVCSAWRVRAHDSDHLKHSNKEHFDYFPFDLYLPVRERLSEKVRKICMHTHQHMRSDFRRNALLDGFMCSSNTKMLKLPYPIHSFPSQLLSHSLYMFILVSISLYLTLTSFICVCA